MSVKLSLKMNIYSRVRVGREKHTSSKNESVFLSHAFVPVSLLKAKKTPTKSSRFRDCLEHQKVYIYLIKLFWMYF